MFLSGPKIQVGNAIAFTGLLLMLCWMLRPPTTYVTVIGEQPMPPELQQ
jgi:hypothetical protein